MSSRPNKPHKNPPNQGGQRRNQQATSSGNIKQAIINEIMGLSKLSDYRVKNLVLHASKFGPYLKDNGLKTNQIRKFLDAINRVKTKLVEAPNRDSTKEIPTVLMDEIVLLKPKLAYAAAKQKAALPLSEVMSAAIEKTKDFQDFSRLFQLIESIIAYHKAEGGE